MPKLPPAHYEFVRKNATAIGLASGAVAFAAVWLTWPFFWMVIEWTVNLHTLWEVLSELVKTLV